MLVWAFLSDCIFSVFNSSMLSMGCNFTIFLSSSQVLICRNEAEKCLIETSINSLRISLKVNSSKPYMDSFKLNGLFHLFFSFLLIYQIQFRALGVNCISLFVVVTVLHFLSCKLEGKIFLSRNINHNDRTIFVIYSMQAQNINILQ